MKWLFETMLRGLVELFFPGLPRKERGLITTPDFKNLEKIFMENLSAISSDTIQTSMLYRGPVRQLILGLKYRNDRAAAKILGELVASCFVEDISDMMLWHGVRVPIIVVPMPVSAARRIKRGYNQCERLLEEIVRLIGGGDWFEINSTSLLKVRDIESQTKQSSKTERQKNIQNSFAVENSLAKNFSGRDIMIFDDVTTTGSTLNEAIQTVLKAGARSVAGLAVAKQELRVAVTEGALIKKM